MPDTALDTKWNLRNPAERAEFVKAVKGHFKGKSPKTCREIADGLKANMTQTRGALNALIAEGVITFSGTTRDMVYSKAG